MNIPTGFLTDLTKNFYGVDVTSPEGEEASTLLWQEFLSRISSKADEYDTLFSANELNYAILFSSTDESTVTTSLEAFSAAATTTLPQSVINQYLGDLAHEIVTQRGSAPLNDLSSTDPATVLNLLTTLLQPYISSPSDPFLLTIVPTLANSIAAANAEGEKLYFNFLAEQLNIEQTAEASIALSPTEISDRQITYTLFDIILTLINLMSNSQAIEANAILFLQNKKLEYVNMMQRMFFYVGKGLVEDDKIQPAADNTPTYPNIDFQVHIAGSETAPDPNSTTPGTPADPIPPYDFNFDFPFENNINPYVGQYDWIYTQTSPSDDPSQFNLGYGNITVQDVFDYLYTSLITSPSSSQTTYNLVSAPWATGTTGTAAPVATYSQNVFSITIGEFSGELSLTCSFNPFQIVVGSGTKTIGINPAYATNTSNTTANGVTTTTFDGIVTSQGTLPSTVTKTEAIALLTTAFNAAYHQAESWGYLDSPTDWPSRNQPKIPWGYYQDPDEPGDFAGILLNGVGSSLYNHLGVADGTSLALVGAAQRVRSAQNQTLNIYLSNTESQIEIINNYSDSQTDLEETSAAEKKQIISILQSFLAQLQNIIASVYR